MLVTLACASALKVTLEYAKLTLAAPAQKTQLSSTRVVRKVCFATIVCFLFLFGSEIQQIINLGKRNSFLLHVLAQLHFHVNSSVVQNSMYMLVQSV